MWAARGSAVTELMKDDLILECGSTVHTPLLPPLLAGAQTVAAVARARARMVLHEDHRQQAHVRFALIDGGRARVVRAIAPPLADSLFFTRVCGSHRHATLVETRSSAWTTETKPILWS